MGAAPQKPPTVTELIWEHDLVFAGRSDQATITLDSDGIAGPSPMQALAFGLAACMAMDVVAILKKGRHDLRGLRADMKGFRSDEPPRRFTRIELRFTVTGTIADEHVQRAIELSRDKYCSVWHSLRQDIGFDVTFTASEGL
jgi:putative redox protein